MTIKELRMKTETELKTMEMDLKEKLRELRFNLAQGKLKNIKSIGAIKKDLARIMTPRKEAKTTEGKNKS